MSLEGLTLCLYCLIALAKTSRSLESVLKYFAAGAISTCFLLFGIFIRFVSCGLQYGASDYTSFSVFPTHEFAGVIFTVSCISALLLKIGSAPYHYWVADAYEGAPTVVMIFMSTVVKLGIFFILIKVLYNPLFSGMIT
jgi:NADH-quinone oxidoreductase subunit N